MAKKGTKLKKPVVRKRPFDVADMERIVEQLREKTAELESLIDDLKAEEIESIKVDGFVQLQRGVETIDKFYVNAVRGFRAVKRDRELQENLER